MIDLKTLPNYCYGEPYYWHLEKDGLWFDPRLIKETKTTRKEIAEALEAIEEQVKNLPKSKLTREEFIELRRKQKEANRGKV